MFGRDSQFYERIQIILCIEYSDQLTLAFLTAIKDGSLSQGEITIKGYDDSFISIAFTWHVIIKILVSQASVSNARVLN